MPALCLGGHTDARRQTLVAVAASRGHEQDRRERWPLGGQASQVGLCDQARVEVACGLQAGRGRTAGPSKAQPSCRSA